MVDLAEVFAWRCIQIQYQGPAEFRLVAGKAASQGVFCARYQLLGEVLEVSWGVELGLSCSFEECLDVCLINLSIVGDGHCCLLGLVHEHLDNAGARNLLSFVIELATGHFVQENALAEKDVALWVRRSHCQHLIIIIDLLDDVVGDLGEPVADGKLGAVPAGLTGLPAEGQLLFVSLLVAHVFDILENEMLDLAVVDLPVVVVKGSLEVDDDGSAEFGVTLDEAAGELPSAALHQLLGKFAPHIILAQVGVIDSGELGLNLCRIGLAAELHLEDGVTALLDELAELSHGAFDSLVEMVGTVEVPYHEFLAELPVFVSGIFDEDVMVVNSVDFHEGDIGVGVASFDGTRTSVCHQIIVLLRSYLSHIGSRLLNFLLCGLLGAIFLNRLDLWLLWGLCDFR